MTRIYTTCYDVCMKRYQVYLDPHSVSIFDEVEKYTDISRSKLIRQVIDAVARNLAKTLYTEKLYPQEKYALDSLVGALGRPGKKTSSARRVNEIYYGR